ncbi:hypothetical protein BDR06DRAFT_969616 [Suillus hirtellus]|nr:hypothetical protein BDR06DRAFT_969616 [Suillus hirtellus]
MLQQLNSALEKLAMKEIIVAVGDNNLKRAEKHKCSDLVAAMQVVSAADAKAAHLQDDEEHQLKKVWLQQEWQTSAKPLFLEEVGDSVQNECLLWFIDHTGNAACWATICVVCAGEFLASETTEFALPSIQHKEVLKLYISHHSQ